MALLRSTPWHYFADIPGGDVEADALTELRTQMGSSYASSPSDASLSRALNLAVRFFERATDRFFVAKTGTITLSGNGEPRLWLPYPVVSSDQVSTATLEIQYVSDDEALDSELLKANDGAREGEDDPRDDPFLEWVPSSSTLTSRSPEAQVTGLFAYGVRNIQVTATWGYLEADGTTPELVQKAIAALTIRNLVDLDDCDGQEDLRRGALVTESVAGRSATLGPNAQGRGLTTDREIDQIIRSYRRPPAAVVSRPPRRSRRRNHRFPFLQ